VDFLPDALKARMRALGLRPEQVEESFTHSGGKGGQNVNKVATCVVLRHLPTGVIVRCSDERGQLQNRALAWERLAEKLEERRRSLQMARQMLVEKERRRNRPRPRGLKEKILRHKKHRGEVKKNRRKGGWDD
jgi:protein subunit release factor B